MRGFTEHSVWVVAACVVLAILLGFAGLFSLVFFRQFPWFAFGVAAAWAWVLFVFVREQKHRKRQ